MKRSFKALGIFFACLAATGCGENDAEKLTELSVTKPTVKELVQFNGMNFDLGGNRQNFINLAEKACNVAMFIPSDYLVSVVIKSNYKIGPAVISKGVSLNEQRSRSSAIELPVRTKENLDPMLRDDLMVFGQLTDLVSELGLLGVLTYTSTSSKSNKVISITKSELNCREDGY